MVVVVDPNPNPNPGVRVYRRVRFHTAGYAQAAGYPAWEVCLLGSTELSRSTDPGQGLRPTEPTGRLSTFLM